MTAAYIRHKCWNLPNWLLNNTFHSAMATITRRWMVLGSGGRFQTNWFPTNSPNNWLLPETPLILPPRMCPRTPSTLRSVPYRDACWETPMDILLFWMEISLKRLDLLRIGWRESPPYLINVSSPAFFVSAYSEKSTAGDIVPSEGSFVAVSASVYCLWHTHKTEAWPNMSRVCYLTSPPLPRVLPRSEEHTSELQSQR